MKSYELPFATIIVLRNDLAEVIINEGVVMDELMVDMYHDFLLTHLKAPFALLVNKKHSYSYTFEAQKTIASLKEISHIAVVVATHGALMSTETLININGSNKWNIRLFQERDLALNWVNNFVTV